MKNFSTYLLVVFVLWAIMSNKGVDFVMLVIRNNWNVTGANLFAGVFSMFSSSITGAGNAIGKDISKGVSNAGQSISTGLLHQVVAVTL